MHAHVRWVVLSTWRDRDGPGRLCRGFNVPVRGALVELVVHLLVAAECGIAGALRVFVWCDLSIVTVVCPFWERRLVVRVEHLRRLVGGVVVRADGRTGLLLRVVRRVGDRAAVVRRVRSQRRAALPLVVNSVDGECNNDDAQGDDGVRLGAIIAAVLG